MALAGQKTSTQQVPALRFWLVRGEGLAHSHAVYQTTDIRLTGETGEKPLCHRKRYCPQTCKHLLACRHLHYTVGGRQRRSVCHLGPHPGSKLRRQAGKRMVLGPCNKKTENMTKTQVLPFYRSLLSGGSWVNTSLVTDGILKV